MYDTFDFFGGILLGTFLGSLATLIYHVRQIRQEARQNYVRLSLAQAEVTTLERTLEIHRGNSIADFTQPIQNPTVPESETPNALPLIPHWMANCEDPTAGELTSEGPLSRAGGDLASLTGARALKPINELGPLHSRLTHGRRGIHCEFALRVS